MMKCEINKLQPMGGDWSAAQMGQHSPNGISGLGQSFSSSQTISSHRTVPVSHTQMRQGSGFHTSLSVYRCPSCIQLKVSSVHQSEGCTDVDGGRKSKMIYEGAIKDCDYNLITNIYI